MNTTSHESATIAYFFLWLGIGLFDVAVMFLATRDIHQRGFSDRQVVYWRLISLVLFPVGLIAYFINIPKVKPG